VRICSVVHEILADKAFTAADGLISQSFVVTFVHPTLCADNPQLGLSGAT